MGDYTVKQDRLLQYMPLIIAFVSFLCCIMLISRTYEGLHTVGDGFDNLDYAQIARNIIKGNGFKTDIIRPSHLKYSTSIPNHELYRSPLYPLLLALAFGLFGAHDYVVVALTSLFFALSLSMMFIILKRIAHPSTALLGCLLLMFDLRQLRSGISGLSEPLFMLLLLLALYMAHKNKERAKVEARGGIYIQDLIFGCLLGLISLTRPYGIIYSIPLGIYSLIDRGIKKRVLIPWIILGLGLPLLPYLIRNYYIYGNPFSSAGSLSLIGFTESSPGWSHYANLHPPSVMDFFSEHFNEFLSKYARNLAESIRCLFSFINPILAVLFIITTMVKWEERSYRLLLKLSISMFIITAFFLSAGTYFVPRFFEPLAPFLAMPVVIFFEKGIRNITGEDRLIRRLSFVCIFIAFLIHLLLSLLDEGSREMPYRKLAEFLSDNTSPDIIVATEIPEYVAWYGSRTALLIPLNKDDLSFINTHIFPIHALFLTDRNRTHMPHEKSWKRNMGKEMTDGFFLYGTFKDNDTTAYLYLKD